MGEETVIYLVTLETDEVEAEMLTEQVSEALEALVTLTHVQEQREGQVGHAWVRATHHTIKTYARASRTSWGWPRKVEIGWRDTRKTKAQEEARNGEGKVGASAYALRHTITLDVANVWAIAHERDEYVPERILVIECAVLWERAREVFVHQLHAVLFAPNQPQ